MRNERILVVGLAITTIGAGLGFLAGLLAEGGSPGFWAFVGLGAGVVLAAAVLGVVVVGNLGADQDSGPSRR